MEEEAVLASSSGSAVSVSDSAATAGGDAKLPPAITMPEISSVTMSSAAIAATVQS